MPRNSGYDEVAIIGWVEAFTVERLPFDPSRDRTPTRSDENSEEDGPLEVWEWFRDAEPRDLAEGG